jgi:hypothetical protein
MPQGVLTPGRCPVTVYPLRESPVGHLPALPAVSPVATGARWSRHGSIAGQHLTGQAVVLDELALDRGAQIRPALRADQHDPGLADTHRSRDVVVSGRHAGTCTRGPRYPCLAVVRMVGVHVGQDAQDVSPGTALPIEDPGLSLGISSGSAPQGK